MLPVCRAYPWEAKRTPHAIAKTIDLFIMLLSLLVQPRSHQDGADTPLPVHQSFQHYWRCIESTVVFIWASLSCIVCICLSEIFPRSIAFDISDISFDISCMTWDIFAILS